MLRFYYKRIAKYLGNTNGAHNPFPILIPCHRAIRSDGTIGWHQGGFRMKQSLLQMEGTLFTTHGRVVTEEFFY